MPPTPETLPRSPSGRPVFVLTDLAPVITRDPAAPLVLGVGLVQPICATLYPLNVGDKVELQATVAVGGITAGAVVALVTGDPVQFKIQRGATVAGPWTDLLTWSEGVNGTHAGAGPAIDQWMCQTSRTVTDTAPATNATNYYRVLVTAAGGNAAATIAGYGPAELKLTLVSPKQIST